MRKRIILIAAALIAAAGVLTALAPDTLSMIILLVMAFALAMGFVLGLLPSMLYAMGFSTARRSIDQALDVQTAEPWYAVFKLDTPFHQKDLDELFRLYRDEAEAQREDGEVVSDIEEWINEEMLGLHTWQGLMTQIPGMLTGLGIIGTFVGLLMGISSIGFSSVETALESVAVLLSGIETAFYTSIAGVILSIMFNIFYRIMWNTLLREYGLFCEYFHRMVVPLAEKQLRTVQQQAMKDIREKLDRLPRYGAPTGVFGGGAPAQNAGNEQILMPEILSGMKNDEFTFYLQPRVELQSRKIVAAEVLVRWQSEKFGLLSAADFVPVLERNGYITRLDQHIWELVFKTIRQWIDAGARPVPLAINVSKTDILAMDIASYFSSMLERYRVPPRYVQLEISKTSYIQTPLATLEVETALRQLGFKVAIDGFDGDYISLNMLERTNADSLNLNLAYLRQKDQDTLEAIFAQARKLKVDIVALSIESTEQITHLKRAGYLEGQGSYYFRPLSIEEFEEVAEL
ncbi:MAG: EAL domain-containing protein [Candidatus Fimadaptatus sp.]